MNKSIKTIIDNIPALISVTAAITYAQVARVDAKALQWVAKDKKRFKSFRRWLRKESKEGRL